MYYTSLAGANCGGTLTSIFTWSGLTEPCTITTSRPWHTCRRRSRRRTATSPRSTLKRYFVTQIKLLRALHAPDARCEVGAEQAVVGSLVGQAAHCCQPQVDGRRSKPSGLQLIAVPKNDGATEGKSGFGAVPGDEIIDGVGIGPLRGDRTKALQN
jgi:hypothetical protein